MDCFKLLNNWCQEKVGQLRGKKNGSLAAPQSANSTKSASRLRKFFPFFFLQFNFTCKEVHDLWHEMKRQQRPRRPFSRSPPHPSDASGDLPKSGSKNIQRFKCSCTHSWKKIVNSLKVATEQRPVKFTMRAIVMMRTMRRKRRGVCCNGKACQKAVSVERFQI